MTQIVDIEPLERTKRIIQLAQEAQQEANDIKRRTRLSIEKARVVGDMLLAEQESIDSAFGKGKWEAYFASHFEKHISRATAFRWMKLARATSLIAPNETAEADPKLIRNGMAALELTPPPKVHVKTQEAGKDAVIEVQANHLGLINRLMAWSNQVLESGEGSIPSEYAAQLLQDFAPVVEFVSKLKEAASAKHS